METRQQTIDDLIVSVEPEDTEEAEEPAKRAPRKKKAETAQEIKEKYGRRRATRTFAPKFFLINYVYWAHLKNEGKKIEALDRVFRDESEFMRVVMGDPYAEGLYDFYCGICVWINTAFESAILVRNSLSEYIQYYYEIVSTVIAGEELRSELIKADALTDKVSLWLRAISADHIRPTESTYHKITGLKHSIRENIDNYLRYLNVYNTLILTMGNSIDVPELSIYQVGMSSIEALLSRLNEALEAARDSISKREVVPEGEVKIALSPPFAQGELEETLKAFAPVGEKAPPIPSKNIAQVKELIKRLGEYAYQFDGSNFFSAMSRDYWRR